MHSPNIVRPAQLYQRQGRHRTEQNRPARQIAHQFGTKIFSLVRALGRWLVDLGLRPDTAPGARPRDKRTGTPEPIRIIKV